MTTSNPSSGCLSPSAGWPCPSTGCFQFPNPSAGCVHSLTLPQGASTLPQGAQILPPFCRMCTPSPPLCRGPSSSPSFPTTRPEAQLHRAWNTQSMFLLSTLPQAIVLTLVLPATKGQSSKTWRCSLTCTYSLYFCARGTVILVILVPELHDDAICETFPTQLSHL